MARITYANADDPAVKPLSDRITAERGSVIHLYKMLLNSPVVAEGWLNYLTAIRQKTKLPAALRELAIIRIALLNNAPYEADQHVPYALKAGVSQAQLDALGDWTSSGAFDVTQLAVLAYVDAMTKSIQVPDEVFEAVRAQFDNELIVELTATIAAYNMVSRFLEALEIHTHD